MKPRKIAFYGYFGQQNWGNECTLQAILYNVRRHLPDAELRCICTGPNDTLRRHNIPAFPVSNRHAKGYPKVAPTQNNSLMRLLRKIFVRIPMEVMDWIKAFKCLRGFDMLVVPGTGLLTDFSTNPLGGPYELFKWSIVARLCRCKLLFVSVGAGPMYHPLTKWLLRWVLLFAVYRSYRDSYSRQFLEQMGIKTRNDPLYPDLAFSLPPSQFPDTNTTSKIGKRPVIGVGVKDYCGLLGLPQRGGEAKYRDFVKNLATFVIRLLDHKYTVRLLIGDTLYDNGVKEDLMELLRQHGFHDNEQIINEPISSVTDVLAQLAASDIVVSARFHNVLLALMLGKPVISLSYHEKFASLVTGVGLTEYCHEIDHLDVDRLITQILELEKRAKELTPHITQKVQQYRNALEEQYTRLFG